MAGWPTISSPGRRQVPVHASSTDTRKPRPSCGSLPDLRKGAAATSRRRRCDVAGRAQGGRRADAKVPGRPVGQAKAAAPAGGAGGTTCTGVGQSRRQPGRTDRSPDGQQRSAEADPARRRTSQRRAALQVLMAVHARPAGTQSGRRSRCSRAGTRVFLAQSRAADRMSGSPVATISSSTGFVLQVGDGNSRFASSSPSSVAPPFRSLLRRVSHQPLSGPHLYHGAWSALRTAARWMVKTSAGLDARAAPSRLSLEIAVALGGALHGFAKLTEFAGPRCSTLSSRSRSVGSERLLADVVLLRILAGSSKTFVALAEVGGRLPAPRHPPHGAPGRVVPASGSGQRRGDRHLLRCRTWRDPRGTADLRVPVGGDPASRSTPERGRAAAGPLHVSVAARFSWTAAGRCLWRRVLDGQLLQPPAHADRWRVVPGVACRCVARTPSPTDVFFERNRAHLADVQAERRPRRGAPLRGG